MEKADAVSLGKRLSAYTDLRGRLKGAVSQQSADLERADRRRPGAVTAARSHLAMLLQQIECCLYLTQTHGASSTAAPQTSERDSFPLVTAFCAHLSQREGRGFKSRQLHKRPGQGVCGDLECPEHLAECDVLDANRLVSLLSDNAVTSRASDRQP